MSSIPERLPSEPADAITHHVATLCNNYHTISTEDARQEIEAIRKQGNSIIYLLGHMINSADNETGKEDGHE